MTLHDHLAFLSPMSSERGDLLAAWLAEGVREGGTVLDVGCGWGELLLRVAAAAPCCRAVGIDIESVRIAEARRRAIERGLDARVTFLETDGTEGPTPVEALVAIGATQVWAKSESLDYGAALSAIRARVTAGARVLYADAIWSLPPTAAAIACFSGREDEFADLPALIALAKTHGFSLVDQHEATLEEWDEFESGFGGGTPRSIYLDGYRGILGMAYLRLLAV